MSQLIKTHRNTVIIYSSLAVAATVALLLPLYSEWRISRENLTNTNLNLDTAIATQQAIEPFIKSNALIDGKAKLAAQLIPISQERERFTSQLDELARANQLSLSALRFSETGSTLRETADVKPIHFTATVSGDYANFHKLVSRIPGLDRFTQLNSVEINVTDSGITAQIAGTIYTQETPKIGACATCGKNLSFGPATWQYIDVYRAGETFEIIQSQGRTNPFTAF
jgi:hypothetical protein